MKFKPLTAQGIKTYSIKDRNSKVTIDDFAECPKAGGSMMDFLDSLPNILGAKDIKEIASRIIDTHMTGKTVAIGMGAHVIKVGLSPIIIEMMERGIISSIAMNGACIVHDFETAFIGCTSEDVDSELLGGNFGMAEETGRLLNGAIKGAAGRGLGRAVGDMINESEFPYKDKSILAAGSRLDIPVTVHVAVGTDILHVHPSVDGAATGEATLKDFQLFTGIVSTLQDGAYINIGSAVLLPEVFLKALTLARNLGHKVKDFTTVNMDFIQHYRPTTNVVKRPVKGGAGKGFSLTGHHEIMVPLLYAAIIEGLD
jgi:hypothetical protein